jgi:hypothetical protein
MTHGGWAVAAWLRSGRTVGMYSTVSCGEGGVSSTLRDGSMGHAPCFLICAVWYMYHVKVYRRLHARWSAAFGSMTYFTQAGSNSAVASAVASVVLTFTQKGAV